MLDLLFPPRFRQWLGPLLVVGAIGAIVALLVVTTGIVNLSARKPHPEGWARFLHYTFKRSVAYHRGPQPPADLDSPIRVRAGAGYYGQVCAHCHSGPGLGQNPVVLMMRPRPQYLYTDLRSPDANYSARDFYRIVHAGVKYSGMPAWPAEGRPDEVWNLVAFLRVLPKLTPEQFRTLAYPADGVASAIKPAFGPLRATNRFTLTADSEPPVTSYNYRWPGMAFGGDNAIAGDPLRTCSQCHGPDGRGGGAFPNLTIQDSSYIRRALIAFANGDWQSGNMGVIARQLSPQQMKAIADHYAALPMAQAPSPPANDLAGQTLALEGDPKLGLGPCAGCHGVTVAAAKAYPRLEGQSAWYIANQMRVFKAGGRGGLKTRNPMPAIAAKLTDTQIEAVARYYAAQQPTPKQSFAAVETP